MKQSIRVYENAHFFDFDTKEAYLQFAKNYHRIFAAGGLVFNSENELLMIYRLKKWDFPKGKMETGETAETSAIREVMEETGLSEIGHIHPLGSTYYIYMLNDKKTLKETFWYTMHGKKEDKLIPQTEEDITDVKWVPMSEVSSYLENSYSSIQNLFSKISNI